MNSNRQHLEKTGVTEMCNNLQLELFLTCIQPVFLLHDVHN